MLSLNKRLSAPELDRIVIDIPLRSRLVPATFAVLFLVAIVSSTFYSVPLFAVRHIVPFVIALLCGIAAVYKERWIFDGRLNTVTRQVGLVFLYGERVIAFSRIARLAMKGLLVMVPVHPSTAVGRDDTEIVASWRSFVSLQIDMSQGGDHRLDQARGRRAAQLEKLGRLIAERSGLELANSIAYDKKASRRRLI